MLTVNWAEQRALPASPLSCSRQAPDRRPAGRSQRPSVAIASSTRSPFPPPGNHLRKSRIARGHHGQAAELASIHRQPVSPSWSPILVGQRGLQKARLPAHPVGDLPPFCSRGTATLRLHPQASASWPACSSSARPTITAAPGGRLAGYGRRPPGSISGPFFHEASYPPGKQGPAARRSAPLKRIGIGAPWTDQHGSGVARSLRQAAQGASPLACDFTTTRCRAATGPRVSALQRLQVALRRHRPRK